MTSLYFLPDPKKGPKATTAQPSMPRLKVFLSHSTSDKKHIELVCQQLQALGIGIYLAEHDHQPGTVLAEKVREAIHQSDAVIALITTTSVNSAYVQQEVGMAHECGKPIVPVVEKGIDTRQLGILQGIEHLELDLEQPAESLARITAGLQPLVIKQVASMKLSAFPDPATAFMIFGLGLLLGIFIAAALSDGGSSG